MTKAATPQQYCPLDYDNPAQNVVCALMEQHARGCRLLHSKV